MNFIIGGVPLKNKILFLVITTITILNAHTNNLTYNHAPIGVMGDHMHSKGEIMFSYRFMNMLMKGNLNGEKKIGTQNYPI